MPKKLPELQVLIPYSQLSALLSVASELEDFRKELKCCHEQLDALRGIQTETLDKYLELCKLL